MPSSDDGGGNKRLVIIGVATLFLVAAVVGVTVGVSNSEKSSSKENNIAASRKAVDEICQPTDYKETCKKSLQNAGTTTNPNELVKAAFNAAMEEISHVSERSPFLQQLQKDPKTAKAAEDCKELFNYACDDFRRSMDQIGNLDIITMDKILSNLRVWLSATVTYQETCLDGFQNETSEAGEKVRKLLSTSMQMSSNGIAIVTGMSEVVGSLQLNKLTSGSKRRLMSSSNNKHRRLLTWSDEFIAGHNEFIDDEFLEKMSRQTHKQGKSIVSGMGPEDMIPRWLDLDDRRRKLLQAESLGDLKPNVIVAQDGSGKYKKIEDAFLDVPKDNNETFVIYVKEGVYKEYLKLKKSATNVLLVGAGPTKTRITGNLNFIDGTPTFKTCTLAVLGDHFMAKDIGIENTAGAEKHQAVALRVQADMAIFYNCHFDGYQDTLYTHTYRQYYRDCKVSGTIDFVFGDAAAFFQNCTFIVRKPLDNQACIVTAQGRKERHQPTGIIIHKSNFVADPEYFPLRFKNKAYLGRPWKEHSKTIIMESNIDDLIQPDGWLPWEGEFGLNTCYYGEYRNEGPGANMEHRVKWPGIKTILPTRAEKFMPPILYEGDDWIKSSGVPYIPTLTTDPSDIALPPGYVDEDPNAPNASPFHDYEGSPSPSPFGSSVEDLNESPSNGYAYGPDSTFGPEPSPSPSPDTSTISPAPTPAPTNNPSLLSQPSGGPSDSPSPSDDSLLEALKESPHSPSLGGYADGSESSPSLSMESLRRTLLQDKLPSTVNLEKNLMHTPEPDETNALERKLDDDNDNDEMVDKDEDDDNQPPKQHQNDDNNDIDEDVDDDHDKLVTSSTVKWDKVLDTLHLRKRSDLSLDQLLQEAKAHSPGPSSSMLSKYTTNNAKSPSSSPSPGQINDMLKAFHLGSHLGSKLSPSSSPTKAPHSGHQSSISPSSSSHKTMGQINEMAKGLQKPSSAPVTSPHSSGHHSSRSSSSSKMAPEAAIKDLEKELMVGEKEGETGNNPDPQSQLANNPDPQSQIANNPDLSKMASSPQSQDLAKQNITELANQNATAALAAAPGAGDFLKQFGVSESTLKNVAPGGAAAVENAGGAEKSGSNVVCQNWFVYTVLAVLIGLFIV